MKICYVVVIEQARRRKPNKLEYSVYYKTKIDRITAELLRRSDEAIPYKWAKLKTYYSVSKKLLEKVLELEKDNK